MYQASKKSHMVGLAKAPAPQLCFYIVTVYVPIMLSILDRDGSLIAIVHVYVDKSAVGRAASSPAAESQPKMHIIFMFTVHMIIMSTVISSELLLQ